MNQITLLDFAQDKKKCISVSIDGEKAKKQKQLCTT